MAKLTDKLRNPTATLSQRNSEPVWKGPTIDGISNSLLQRFLCCRERFRIQVVEGLKPKDKFNPSIEYGSLWHTVEEAYAKDKKSCGDAAQNYCVELGKKYPMNREDITHWYSLCLVQFPVYVEYWAKHPDMVTGKVLEQEQVFNVSYKLPSGRVVKLRGKRDRVDLVGKGIWLQENKTKSQIDQQKIGRQVSYDLQTMIYLVALEYKDWRESCDIMSEKSPINIFSGKPEIKGVRYNVIRRSAHKSVASMEKKMLEDIEDGRGGEWFSRWNVEISKQDIENFKVRTLNPILEQLCDWWEWIVDCNKTGADIFSGPNVKDCASGWCNRLHWQAPFGCYDVLKEGGSSDLDSYISEGSTIGLERSTNLFPELT